MTPEISMLGVKASYEWLAWLDDLAIQTGMPKSEITERAITKFARELGAPDPPARMTIPQRLKNAKRRQKAVTS